MKNIFYFVIGWPLFQSSSIAQVLKTLHFVVLRLGTAFNRYLLPFEIRKMFTIWCPCKWCLIVAWRFSGCNIYCFHWQLITCAIFHIFVVFNASQDSVGNWLYQCLYTSGGRNFPNVEIAFDRDFFFIVAWEVKLKNETFIGCNIFFFKSGLKHPRNHLAVGCTSVCTPMEKFEHMVSYF